MSFQEWNIIFKPLIEQKWNFLHICRELLEDLLGYKDVANQLFENYRAERELLAGYLK